MKTIAQHKKIVERISSELRKYTSQGATKKIRFYHGGTNSTREQTKNENYYFIDILGLDDVLEVNTEEFYALVEPNVSMDKLAKATLEYGLLPPVIMEFPGITAGGAVNGATLEASSYKYGQFNDICKEYEIILGNGDIVRASKEKHEDLFYGISGSYGSLGLLTLIKVNLIPVKPYVKTVFTFTGNYKNTIDRLRKEADNHKADFIDSIVFDSENSVVITGYFHEQKDEKVEEFLKPINEWFYEKAKKIANKKGEYEELIPIFDFLFRYNRGAYWMGEYVFPILHIPDDKLTKIILNPFMNTRKLYDGLHAVNISQEFFIQDFYCPAERTLELLEELEEKLNIFPVWLCPVKATKSPQKLSPSYINTSLIIDVGIWGTSKKFSKSRIALNRYFEIFTEKIKARKMLYAHSYYPEDEFWNIYDKKWYEDLRKKYHSDAVFPDVWYKTHVEQKPYKTHWAKGILHLLRETIKGKNLKSTT